VSHRVDLSDRADADSAERGMIVDQALDSWAVADTLLRIGSAIRWTSDPLPAAVEVSGLFSGRLEFIANKRDFDVSVTLYERTTAGQYIHLAYYWTRASYAADRSRRSLLKPGRREHFAFQSGRFTSRSVQAGSRLVVVLGILKQPWEQINYGTGKDVSDETIADAREPLEVRWLRESYVRLPTRR
jgi:predicted acyl esterase